MLHARYRSLARTLVEYGPVALEYNPLGALVDLKNRDAQPDIWEHFVGILLVYLVLEGSLAVFGEIAGLDPDCVLCTRIRAGARMSILCSCMWMQRRTFNVERMYIAANAER